MIIFLEKGSGYKTFPWTWWFRSRMRSPNVNDQDSVRYASKWTGQQALSVIGSEWVSPTTSTQPILLYLAMSLYPIFRSSWGDHVSNVQRRNLEFWKVLESAWKSSLMENWGVIVEDNEDVEMRSIYRGSSWDDLWGRAELLCELSIFWLPGNQRGR